MFGFHRFVQTLFNKVSMNVLDITDCWQGNSCLKTNEWKNDKLLELIPWFPSFTA